MKSLVKRLSSRRTYLNPLFKFRSETHGSNEDSGRLGGKRCRVLGAVPDVGVQCFALGMSMCRHLCVCI